jgi:nucleotidyltransferase substrate binding protein (TIGR01987 family)
MEKQDIRWEQRFEDYICSYESLRDAFLLFQERELTILECRGVVQAFKVTLEISWETMRYFLEAKGFENVCGSKKIIRKAFNINLIKNGGIWLKMIELSDLMSDMYDKNEMMHATGFIFSNYIEEFEDFKQNLFKLSKDEMFGIHKETTDLLMSIFEKHDCIQKVIIYGSRAKGNYREGSDIDLTLKGYIETRELSVIVKKIQDSYTPYLFDISIYNDLVSCDLKESIDRDGKTFYKRKN